MDCCCVYILREKSYVRENGVEGKNYYIYYNLFFIQRIGEFKLHTRNRYQFVYKNTLKVEMELYEKKFIFIANNRNMRDFRAIRSVIRA